jgi:hypothetical protein
MKERPILFSAPMVRAILEGRKTVTRRILKPCRNLSIVNLAEAEPSLGYSGRVNDPDSWGYEFLDDGAPAPLSDWRELCPYGQLGDRLWVRETWCTDSSLDNQSPSSFTAWPVKYLADNAARTCGAVVGDTNGRTRSSIHMPRWASRITLEVTGVRVERLQDIDEAGAQAEGCQAIEGAKWHTFAEAAAGIPMHKHTAIDAFGGLWESIHGADSWDANPWVWAIEFKRLEQPHA